MDCLPLSRQRTTCPTKDPLVEQAADPHCDTSEIGDSNSTFTQAPWSSCDATKWKPRAVGWVTLRACDDDAAATQDGILASHLHEVHLLCDEKHLTHRRTNGQPHSRGGSPLRVGCRLGTCTWYIFGSIQSCTRTIVRLYINTMVSILGIYIRQAVSGSYRTVHVLVHSKPGTCIYHGRSIIIRKPFSYLVRSGTCDEHVWVVCVFEDGCTHARMPSGMPRPLDKRKIYHTTR